MKRQTSRRTSLRGNYAGRASRSVARHRAVRPVARLAYPGRPSRIRSRGYLAASVAVISVLALAGFVVVRARGAACHPSGDRIIWAEQVTQQEGDNPNPPPDLVSRADELAACGGGQLIVLRAAGQGAVQAGPAVSLVVYREPGEIEKDPTARQRGIQKLVDGAFAAAESVRPPGAGRDLIGLFGHQGRTRPGRQRRVAAVTRLPNR